MTLLIRWILFFAFWPFSLCAQTPTVQWQRIVGGIQSATANAIIRTNDGGYAIAGETGLYAPNTHGSADGFVTRLDSDGKVLWQFDYGGPDEDALLSIIQTSDSGFVAVGKTANAIDLGGKSSGFDVWILRLDANGAVRWDRHYGGSGDDIGHSIVSCIGGGYVIASETASDDGDVVGYHGGLDPIDALTPEIWILNITDSGDLRWQRILGGSGGDVPHNLILTHDGYLFSSLSHSTDGDVKGNTDVLYGGDWIVDLDSVGDIRSQRFIHYAVGSIVSIDGGFFISGGTVWDSMPRYHPFTTDGWIARLDSNCNTLWQVALGGSYLDYVNAIEATEDGGAILAGYTESTDGDCSGNPYFDSLHDHGVDGNAWIIKVDSNGIIEWSKFIGASGGYAEAKCIIPISKDSYIFCGQAHALQQNGDLKGLDTSGQAWVVKLAPVPSGVAEQPTAADIISYASSSPNPTGEGTVITFGLSKEAYVKINLFDILGHEVTSPGFEGLFAPGNHEVPLSLQNLPSGTYFARILTAYGNVATVKLVKE